MCGIAGIYAYHSAASCVDQDELIRMRDRMAMRGPDGCGAWLSQNRRVGLGHRRLSIIDLSDRAAQPMESRDGEMVISYNGEIYNYQVLRAELESAGYNFCTQS